MEVHGRQLFVSTGYLKGRQIALGVGGGIAAYKAGDLIRELRRHGAQVRVAMTKAAQEFITPLTLQSLSGQPVLTDYFDTAQEAQFGHLHLARWADAFIVAPATADLLARLRAGQGNDAVTTSLLAFRGPVLLAPAMNTAMWDHESTQENVRALMSISRMRMVGPAVGALADGDVGAGRLADLKDLIAAAEALGKAGALANKKVLITAGPTREALDPVRFLSNPSTGKMGLAMAHAARSLGADVTVVLGPVADSLSREGLEVVDVTTAEQMAEAVLERVGASDYFIATAAVSDWRPLVTADEKAPKSEGPETLTLVRTQDVLAAASAQVRALPKRPVLVGFAAQTHDIEKYALEKLKRKNLDFIVANDVSAAGGKGGGFGSDSNHVTVLSAEGVRREASGSKREVAATIWSIVAPEPHAR